MGSLVIVLLALAVTVPIAFLVNRIVPDPYMDEIFHVPQTQRYCQGDFTSWDPMITTLPGLYCISIAYIASSFPVTYLLGLVSSFQDACSTTMLRSVNIILAVICSILFYKIIIALRPESKPRHAVLCAFVLSLYPLHWFFTFLFYTDVASTAAVMAMYLACLKQSYWLSAMLGCLAVSLRQTNIIWVLFVAFEGVMEHLNRFSKRVYSFKGSNVHKEVVLSSAGLKKLSGLSLKRRKKSNTRILTNDVAPKEIATDSEQGLLMELLHVACGLWHEKWGILVKIFPFLFVAVAFVAFVMYNGSIVMGAKDAHTVSPHFAQILYFGLAAAVGMAPLHFNITQAKLLLQPLKERRIKFLFMHIVIFCVAILSVHYFSLTHPYLLADNRHYPFYIWRKIIQFHWAMKYLLIPLYLFSWSSILNLLGKIYGKVWIFVFFLATAAVLVPSPLIEFRYYTLPFYFIFLQMHVKEIHLVLIGVFYAIINFLSIYLFLFKPFHWVHEPGTQRFMW